MSSSVVGALPLIYDAPPPDLTNMIIGGALSQCMRTGGGGGAAAYYHATGKEGCRRPFPRQRTISIDWLRAHVAKTNDAGRGVGEVCQAVSPGVKLMLFYFPNAPTRGHLLKTFISVRNTLLGPHYQSTDTLLQSPGSPPGRSIPSLSPGFCTLRWGNRGF